MRDSTSVGLRIVSLMNGTSATRCGARRTCCRATSRDRKSTRLNSSHLVISYAVFCLKKKKQCTSGLQASPAPAGRALPCPIVYPAVYVMVFLRPTIAKRVRNSGGRERPLGRHDLFI